MLGSIGEMCKHLRYDPMHTPLDAGHGIQKLKNFQGPLCLDFSTQAPRIDWDDDEQLTSALELCVRQSRMEDRTTRSVPREFEEYRHPRRLQLARAIHAAMQELAEDTSGEEVVELSASVWSFGMSRA